MSWYRQGTLNLANGSAFVTGVGTGWVGKVMPGSILVLPGNLQIQEVLEVTSDTQLKIARAWEGATTNGLTYGAAPTQAYLPELAQRVTDLLGTFGDVKTAWLDGSLRGDGLKILGSVANQAALPVTPKTSDAYLINGDVFTWTGSAWFNAGPLRGAKGDTGDANPITLTARDTAVAAANSAIGSADAALASRNSASTSAGTATTKAGEASASASAAAGSATTASTAATTATTKAGEADASKQAAASSATTASTAATTATTKAGEAAGSASTASTAATTATTKAGEAGASAGTATTKAGEAAGSASTALSAKAAAEAARDSAIATVGIGVGSATPKAAAGTGAVGTSSLVSREDHVHPAPTLGTAAALDVAASGDASAAQVVKGNDGRLSDARTPKAHSHPASEISDGTAVGQALVKAVDAPAARTTLGLGTAAVLSVPASGDATAGQVVKGNDGRLSDARTPTGHSHSASGISDSTPVGRAVLTAADAATARTALGVTGALLNCSYIDADTLAVHEGNYVLKTNNLVLTLPLNPVVGMWIRFRNRTGKTGSSINRNGQLLMGLAENMSLSSLNAKGMLVFFGGTEGWVLL